MPINAGCRLRIEVQNTFLLQVANKELDRMRSQCRARSVDKEPLKIVLKNFFFTATVPPFIANSAL